MNFHACPVTSTLRIKNATLQRQCSLAWDLEVSVVNTETWMVQKVTCDTLAELLNQRRQPSQSTCPYAINSRGHAFPLWTSIICVDKHSCTPSTYFGLLVFPNVSVASENCNEYSATGRWWPENVSLKHISCLWLISYTICSIYKIKYRRVLISLSLIVWSTWHNFFFLQRIGTIRNRLQQDCIYYDYALAVTIGVERISETIVSPHGFLSYFLPITINHCWVKYCSI